MNFLSSRTLVITVISVFVLTGGKAEASATHLITSPAELKVYLKVYYRGLYDYSWENSDIPTTLNLNSYIRKTPARLPTEPVSVTLAIPGHGDFEVRDGGTLLALIYAKDVDELGLDTRRNMIELTNFILDESPGIGTSDGLLDQVTALREDLVFFDDHIRDPVIRGYLEGTAKSLHSIQSPPKKWRLEPNLRFQSRLRKWKSRTLAQYFLAKRDLIRAANGLKMPILLPNSLIFDPADTETQSLLTSSGRGIWGEESLQLSEQLRAAGGKLRLRLRYEPLVEIAATTGFGIGKITGELSAVAADGTVQSKEFSGSVRITTTSSHFFRSPAWIESVLGLLEKSSEELKTMSLRGTPLAAAKEGESTSAQIAACAETEFGH